MTAPRTDNDRRDPPERVVRPVASATYVTAWSGIYRDRVSWAGIWGGLLTALGLFVLLSVLATAVGITTVNQTDANPAQVSRIAGLATAVLALASFFVGGFIAGLGGGVVGRDAGGINGFLVWALALVVMLVLAAMGLGQLFGAIGAGFDAYRQFQGAVQIDPQAVAEGLQASAWITFISLGLAATAATLGGALGAVGDDTEKDR